MNFISSEETFQQQALEIREPGDDFDPATVPQNGEEYLMHMLYERKKCPAVVVRRPKTLEYESKAIDAIAAVNTQSFEAPPKTRRPTSEWKAKQATDFQETRESVRTLRTLRASNPTKIDNILSLPPNNDLWEVFCREHKPLLSTVLQIKQRVLEELLEHLCEWLGCTETGSLTQEVTERDDLSVKEKSVNNHSTTASIDVELVDLSSSHAWLAQWLFATLACLHLPLEPNVHSTLREIARRCIQLRSKLEQTDNCEKEVPFNYFIHLIANVFEQLDFADYV